MATIIKLPRQPKKLEISIQHLHKNLVHNVEKNRGKKLSDYDKGRFDMMVMLIEFIEAGEIAEMMKMMRGDGVE